MNIFTENFLNIPTSEIVKRIQEEGYFKSESALTNEFMSNIEVDVNKAGLSLNNNKVSGVYYTHGAQFF